MAACGVAAIQACIICVCLWHVCFVPEARAQTKGQVGADGKTLHSDLLLYG